MLLFRRLLSWMRQGRLRNVAKSRGGSPLLVAVRAGDFESFRRLLDQSTSLDPSLLGYEFYEAIFRHYDRRFRSLAFKRMDFTGWGPTKLLEIARIAIAARRRAFALGILRRLRGAAASEAFTSSECSRVELNAGYRRNARLVRAYYDLGLLTLVKDEWDCTPLQIVLRARLKDAADELLSQGASVEDVGENSDPPLLTAADSGLNELLPKLLAPLPSRLKLPTEALFNAIDSDNSEAIRDYLKAGGNPNAKHLETRLPAIVHALERQRTSAVAWLLTYDAEVDVEATVKDEPLLCMAISSGSLGMVRLLLWKGCDPNYRGRRVKFYPMMRAVPQVHMLRALIAGRGDVNLTTHTHERPLSLASMMGAHDSIDVLAEAGADLNQTCSDYGTALHWALLTDNPETVRKLLALGVDHTIRNSRGETPLEYAMSMQHFKSAKVLRDAGAVDEYAVPPTWRESSSSKQHDYFISYRHKKYAADALELARLLRERDCTVFIDADSAEIRKLRDQYDIRVPHELLRELLFKAIRASRHTLFYESYLEVAVDPLKQRHSIVFSWQLFEQVHSDDFSTIRGVPSGEQIARMAENAAWRRKRAGVIRHS